MEGYNLTDIGKNIIYKMVLPNGLKIFYHRDPYLKNSGSIRFDFNVGHQNDKLSNLSHLTEHLLGGYIQDKSFLESFKDRDNASTTVNHTSYYTYNAKDFYPALESYLDSFMRPKIDSRLEAEKQIVLIENQMHLDNLSDKNLFLLKVLHNDFPCYEDLQKSLIDLPKITLADVKKHISTYYVPNNCEIYLSARYKPQEVLTKIIALTQNWQPNQDLPHIPSKLSQLPAQSFVDQEKTLSNYIIYATQVEVTLKNFLQLCLLEQVLETSKANFSTGYEEARFKKPLSYYTINLIVPGKGIVGLETQTDPAKTTALMEALKATLQANKEYLKKTLNEGPTDSNEEEVIPRFIKGIYAFSDDPSCLPILASFNTSISDIINIVDTFTSESILSFYDEILSKNQWNYYVHGTLSEEDMSKYSMIYEGLDIEAPSFLA
jgi:predicted Zn-dependent peptidase